MWLTSSAPGHMARNALGLIIRPFLLCLVVLGGSLGCEKPDDPPMGEQDLGTAPDLAKPGSNTGTVCDPMVPRPKVPELFVGPMDLEARLLAELGSAKVSLDLFMYNLTRESFITALIDAHKRGVKVRVIVDGKQDENVPTKMRFREAGVPIKDSAERFPYFHAKTIVIDRKKAVIMSANMDNFSMDRARNYGVFNEDPDDLTGLQVIFEADWNGGADPDLSCTRLVVSPVNSLDRLRKLVMSAKKRLDLQLMYLSERTLVDAVKAKVKEGVPVRILLATPNFISGNKEDAQEYLAAGAEVKYFFNNHAKLLVADDTAFVGSENMSWTSLSKNRELGILVTEKAPADKAASQFETDWGKGVMAP